MPIQHKNKTLATLLASTLGGIGLHRFYLAGWKDTAGWLHLLLTAGSLLVILLTGPRWLFSAAPLVLSVLTAFIEALVIGLTPDERWDQRYNPISGRQSASNWPLAVILVFTVGIGATALIAALARSVDLLFTGGAYG